MLHQKDAIFARSRIQAAQTRPAHSPATSQSHILLFFVCMTCHLLSRDTDLETANRMLIATEKHHRIVLGLSCDHIVHI